ncbi:MAG: rRNA adenine N-6-methyltransferase family protein, partial [Bdellovibrionota bacterium]
MKRKPKFGQNFLVDRAWQKRIVEAFRPDAAFAEIGYGEGALTKLLLERFKFFVVFEIDESLIAKANLSHEFNMIHLDFLKWDFHLNDERVENFSLISNLPYESSTAILLRVIERADQIEHFVFM